MSLRKESAELAAFAEKLYPFAFALINDETAAYQIVVDSLSRMTIQHRDSMDSLLMYRYCFKQAEKVLQNHAYPTNTFFDHLSLDEKATLFLREKASLTPEEITVVMESSNTSVLALLTNARKNLFTLMGERYYE